MCPTRTKQERRELQERQRAAKAAKTATGANGKPQGGKPANQPAAGGGAPSRKTADAASKLPSTGPAKTIEKAKAGQSSAADQLAKNQARGLLIFSHFGLPKPVSSAKGDIHPVIARTALQFSSFKITGANARCIATLTAFKTVSSNRCASCTNRILICIRSYKTMLPHQIIPCPAIS